MKDQEKHCNTCASSYYQEEKNVNGGKDMVRMQHALQLARLHQSDVTGGLGQRLLPFLDPNTRERKRL